MKQFILITSTSNQLKVSGNQYIYFIKSARKPTEAQIERFLRAYATEKDREGMLDLIEIKPKMFNPIPSAKEVKETYR